MRPETVAYLIAAALLVSCASLDDLPASTQDVDFSAPDGRLSKHPFEAAGHESSYDFPRDDRIDLKIALKAAEAGIVYSGLKVVQVNEEEFFVVGRRGMSMRHYVEYAGIYLKQDLDVIRAKIFVHGESWDMTTGKSVGDLKDEVIRGMTRFLEAELREQ
jgi:hypothetical protein